MTRGQVSEDKVEDIIEMARAGLGVNVIAAEIQLAPSTVYRILSENDVDLKRYARESFRSWTPEEKDEFLARYYDLSVPILALLDQYHMTHPQLYTLLGEMGLPARTKRPEVVDAKAAALEHALDLYQNTTLTIAEIFAETGVHQPTLHAEIRARDIPLRKPRVHP